MWNTVKQLLNSKKALVAILTVVAFIAGLLGTELNVVELTAALAPLYLYIVAQALGPDFKKEAAKELAAAEAGLSIPMLGENDPVDPT